MNVPSFADFDHFIAGEVLRYQGKKQAFSWMDRKENEVLGGKISTWQMSTPYVQVEVFITNGGTYPIYHYGSFSGHGVEGYIIWSDNYECFQIKFSGGIETYIDGEIESCHNHTEDWCLHKIPIEDITTKFDTIEDDLKMIGRYYKK